MFMNLEINPLVPKLWQLNLFSLQFWSTWRICKNALEERTYISRIQPTFTNGVTPSSRWALDAYGYRPMSSVEMPNSSASQSQQTQRRVRRMKMVSVQYSGWFTITRSDVLNLPDKISLEQGICDMGGCLDGFSFSLGHFWLGPRLYAP